MSTPTSRHLSACCPPATCCAHDGQATAHQASTRVPPARTRSPPSPTPPRSSRREAGRAPTRSRAGWRRPPTRAWPWRGTVKEDSAPAIDKTKGADKGAGGGGGHATGRRWAASRASMARATGRPRGCARSARALVGCPWWPVVRRPNWVPQTLFFGRF